MKISTPRRFAAFLVALALVALGLVLVRALWRLHLPYVNTVVGLGLGCLCLIVAMLAAWRMLSAFLYKVGRRLSFSYFLIGVLPIPMVLLLLAVVAYLLACFFIGHVYRDALGSLDAEVVAATRERAAHYLVSGKVPDPRVAGGAMPGMVFAYYRNGERIAGDPRAPAHWPAWASQPAAARTATAALVTASPAAASAATAAASPGSASSGAGAGPGTGTGAGTRSGTGTGSGTETGTGSGSPGTASPGAGLASLPRFYSGALGCPTLAAAAGGASRGALGVYTGDLDFELSRRSGLWVETNRPGDPVDVMRIKLGSRELPLLTLHRGSNLGEAQRFFKQRSRGDWFLDRQLLWWGQASGPLVDLAGSRVLTGSLLVTLSGTPRIVRQHLFAANGEIDAPSWAVLVGLAVLLFNVYAAAALMALFMIVGLSRAVNRLSRATDAVRRGDFSVRIPGGRRDQIGDLQRTFNEMAANLETLVAASAQKELLEKELSLARDLQNSLIPSNLPSGEGVEFATLFEPSAAIGGDYFDVLRLSEREIAVIIADVSGHGLSTGLRMAMLKAALLILIEETRKPEEILRRLDAVVRSNAEGRCFVTATLAMFDLRAGRLTLTNAGHPPTYIVRAGKVQEILLPSSPLGALGHNYARRELTLDRGDVVVWLSDGVFEETNAEGEPFGYDRIETALAAAAKQPGAAGAAGGTSATGARRRALAAAGTGGGAGAAAARQAGAHLAEPSAAAVRDRLLAAVAAHVGTQPPTDDRTVVVMRWGGPLTVALEATAEAAAVPA
ncbi:MAG TPA: SpoIIE family protein phosphatase [Thermoanaerobaculia bacterium]|nr:SpoIIE family protein phosphatase [Thermoanaerobaculia bacterium]